MNINKITTVNSPSNLPTWKSVKRVGHVREGATMTYHGYNAETDRDERERVVVVGVYVREGKTRVRVVPVGYDDASFCVNPDQLS